MPSAQVINFGEDPRANAIGGFAKNFLQTIEKKTEQRRNEDIFKKIADNYGPNAKTEDVLRDVIKAEGLGDEFRKDRIKELTDYAALKNKSELNGYEQAKLLQRQQELAVRDKELSIKEQRLVADQDADIRRDQKAARDLTKDVVKYNQKLIENSRVKYSPTETAAIDTITEQLMAEEKIGLPEASSRAIQVADERREALDEAVITPAGWTGDNEETIEAAFNDLLQIYQQYHPTQTELRKIAEKNHTKGVAQKLVQRVLQVAGKKMLGPQPKSPQEQAAEDAALLGL